jgi:DNA-binding NtrC family response regulator
MPPAPILVVDDDPDTRASLSDVLTDLGYQVDVADGGRSALALASRGGYGLALLDYRMPDMDGVEVFVRLREARPGVVGVLVTGFAADETVAAATRAGVRRVVPKPVDFGRLLPLVEEAVGRPG